MKIEQMISNELYSSVKNIRESSEQYEEFVILQKDISGWNEILTEILGSPISPAGNNGSSEELLSSKESTALKLAESHGGIRRDQTLHYGSLNSSEVLILIWPWQDNNHVTIRKIIVN